MKISLIHPSRGRALQSFKNHSEWIEKANVADVETIVAVDASDDQSQKYLDLYRGSCFIGPNSSVVEATNYAAEKATGDILIYLSDDFRCPDDWANLVIEEFKKYNGPTLVKVDDCLQRFDVAVLTIPMMNRALYEKLGYFWHPEYKSMFVDEDLYWTATKLRALKFASHLKFPHEHVSVGKAKDDETYRRSAANWNQGKDLFKKRKSAGFPL